MSKALVIIGLYNVQIIKLYFRMDPLTQLGEAVIVSPSY